jgi:thiol-disulfide isomerase/thioredoxin
MMNTVRSLCVTALLATGTSAFSAEPQTPATLEIGAAAPDFNLPGIDGRDHRLSEYSGAKVLVLVFTANHCPTAQAYEARLIKLAADYKDKGVAVVAVSCNDPCAVRLDEMGYTDLGDSFEDMKIRAADMHFNFPYLYDGKTQSVSRAYGAVSTPHAFVFDSKRRLQYTGAIDNNEDPGKANRSYVVEAIACLLTGKPVAIQKVKTFGCSVKWADKRKGAEKALQDWAKEPVRLTPADANAVRDLVKNPTKKLRLINVWATWCGPCVTEIPELVEINRMYRNRAFEMVTISGDTPSKKDDVLAFLKERQVSCANFLFSSEDKAQLVDSVDKAWEGGIPYTLIVKPGGEVLYRHAGAIDPAEVKKVIVGYLGRYFF